MKKALAICLFLLPSLFGKSIQVLRTFHAADDAKVPAALSQSATKLPSGDIVAFGSDGATWIGSSQGLLRMDPRSKPENRRRYFAGLRWLPDDKVVALAPDAAGGMWVKTETGIAHLELKMMTLAEKAAYFEKRVQLRHDRHGMVADSHLRVAGDVSSNEMVSSDNDGLWTAMYGAAKLYEYGTTRSAEALARARKSIEAVLYLEQVTGRPGFPARSWITAEERRPEDGVWYWTPDKKIQWKADTSSDEIVGHFYLFTLAFQLLPPNDALRPKIAATSRRIMDHILSNNYYLIDVTGKPTRWGKWNQAYFDTNDGKPDAPLNATELLSFLKSAHYITGDARYDREYRKVAFELGYLEITTHYLDWMEELNYSDEELAMLTFYPLFALEKDPKILDVLRRAVDGWWKNEEREKNPLWTYIYKLARPEAKLDMEGARWTLERIPMDIVAYTMKNSHRADVDKVEGKDRHGRAEFKTLLPADERPVMKWNGNPFVIDGGNGGRSEDDGGFYLLPYWMGRYLRYLGPEQ